MALWSLRLLYVLLFFAVFGDFIANEKPITCKINGERYLPIFKQYAVDLNWSQWESEFVLKDWTDHEYESVLFPIIPYSSQTRNVREAYLPPLSQGQNKDWKFRHWLGTDHLGQDTLAGLIKGTRTALLVGIISMSIAAIIGIFFGAIAGYFGDDRMRASRGRLVLNILILPFAIFYGFISRSYAITSAENTLSQVLISLLIFSGIILLVNFLHSVFPTSFVGTGQVRQIKKPNKLISLPLDLLIMRLIEIMNSIPALLLILASVAIIKEPSIIYIMVIIGLIRWTSIARFIRGELLRIRKLPYIESTQAMGFDESRILIKHAIPNALTPVLITIAFGIASAILIEASLSFLGIGVPVGEVTWGSMLSKARTNFSAWWLAIFPGLAIFVTVTIFNLIGEGLSDTLNPKS